MFTIGPDKTRKVFLSPPWNVGRVKKVWGFGNTHFLGDLTFLKSLSARCFAQKFTLSGVLRKKQVYREL